MGLRTLNYAKDHPYYQRAKRHAGEHCRPIEWSFYDCALWVPIRTARGVELHPPRDPQSGLPGREFSPVPLPETPEGWVRTCPKGSRPCDRPAKHSARAAVPAEVLTAAEQEELF